MSGLKASLGSAPGIDLRMVDAQPEYIREQITGWSPEVVMLEAGLYESTFSLSLLHDFPQLKLIGLDIENDRLLVFSGQASQQPTPEFLLQLIEG